MKNVSTFKRYSVALFWSGTSVGMEMSVISRVINSLEQHHYLIDEITFCSLLKLFCACVGVLA